MVASAGTVGLVVGGLRSSGWWQRTVCLRLDGRGHTAMSSHATKTTRVREPTGRDGDYVGIRAHVHQGRLTARAEKVV